MSRLPHASDHFDGKRFFNRHGPTIDRSLADIWRWRRTSRPAPWPDPLATIATDHPPRRSHAPRLAMIGHASLLIQAGGANILIDPVWSRRASPLSFAGPSRHQPPGIAFADLPPIDTVLLTHSHYDHMDLPTLQRLHQAHRPRFIAPLGNDAILAPLPTQTADWWQTLDLAAAASLTLVPANHWSSRTLTDRRRALWCGYVLAVPDHAPIYLAGDTAFGDGTLFDEIRTRLAPGLAVLPIGAYEPRWFMAAQHMNPEEAVQACIRCGALQGLGIHWGTFQLTDEAIDAPPVALAAALKTLQRPSDFFRPLGPGEVWQGQGASPPGPPLGAEPPVGVQGATPLGLVLFLTPAPNPIQSPPMSETQTLPEFAAAFAPLCQALGDIGVHALQLLKDLSQAIRGRPTAPLPANCTDDPAAAHHRVSRAFAWLCALAATLSGQRTYVETEKSSLPPGFDTPDPPPCGGGSAGSASSASSTSTSSIGGDTRRGAADKHELEAIRASFRSEPIGDIAGRLCDEIGLLPDNPAYPHPLLALTETPLEWIDRITEERLGKILFSTHRTRDHLRPEDVLQAIYGSDWNRPRRKPRPPD